MTAEWWTAGALTLIAACVSLGCVSLVVAVNRARRGLQPREQTWLRENGWQVADQDAADVQPWERERHAELADLRGVLERAEKLLVADALKWLELRGYIASELDGWREQLTEEGVPGRADRVCAMLGSCNALSGVQDWLDEHMPEPDDDEPAQAVLPFEPTTSSYGEQSATVDADPGRTCDLVVTLDTTTRVERVYLHTSASDVVVLGWWLGSARYADLNDQLLATSFGAENGGWTLSPSVQAGPGTQVRFMLDNRGKESAHVTLQVLGVRTEAQS